MASFPLLTVTPLNSPYTLQGPADSGSYLGITVALGGTLDITGSNTDVSTAALIEAAGGTINVDNGATFDIEGLGAQALSGAINIGSGGTVEEGTNLAAIAPVNFTDNTGTLFLNQTNLANLQLASPITGFQLGDRIEVNSTVTSASYDSSTDTLTLMDGSTTVATLALTGTGLDHGFSVTQGANGDYFIGVACFLPGTKVLTEQGEVAIENVRIGDRLVTASGEAKPVKWVGRRSYPEAVVKEAPHLLPILIRQGALDGTLPRRDLYLSPCHALLIDGVLIDAQHLVNGVSIERCTAEGDLTYHNVEFAEHEAIYVEGAAAESFYCNGGNRQSYDNWQEYQTLYPDEVLTWNRPQLAPRLDCGFAVEAVRRRIDRLAGIDRPEHAAVGRLQGWIEKLKDGVVRGWACDAANPTEPVVLDVLIDDRSIGQVIANDMRRGRAEAGHPTGRCGFQFHLPAGLSPYERHVVRVRRVADGTDLAGSPALLEAAVRLTPGGQRRLADLLDSAATVSAEDMDQALGFLTQQASALLQARIDLSGRRAERTAPAVARGWSEPIPPVSAPDTRVAA